MKEQRLKKRRKRREEEKGLRGFRERSRRHQQALLSMVFLSNRVLLGLGVISNMTMIFPLTFKPGMVY